MYAIAGGRPYVIADPLGAVAQQFMTLGAAVVQEVAKLKLKPRNSVRWGCLRCASFEKGKVQGHVLLHCFVRTPFATALELLKGSFYC